MVTTFCYIVNLNENDVLFRSEITPCIISNQPTRFCVGFCGVGENMYIVKLKLFCTVTTLYCTKVISVTYYRMNG